jgi:hypothetical protein
MTMELRLFATLLRWLSVLLFVSALVAIVTLLVSDTVNHLQLTAVHRMAGAWSFVLIGLSFLSLQFSLRRRWNEQLREILLGVAFLFWGSSQFLSPSPWVTAMDTAVVVIFVFDLSSIIVERLRQKQNG